MGDIILIAAVAENGVVGINNQLPWPKISEDFQRFKSLTVGNSVVMGRKTFESIYEITKKSLVKRENIVLTRSNNTFPDGVKVMKSIDDVLNYSENVEKMFIIGGEEIYKQFLPYANKMEITRINRDYQGDAFFPKYNEKDWILRNREDRDFFSFLSYERRLDSFF